jgi:hypothetical protein
MRVVAPPVRGEHAAHVADEELHAGIGEQAAGVLRKLASHHPRDLRIELDGLYAACTMLARAKDLETAASTDDEHGSRRGDLVCEGTGTVTRGIRGATDRRSRP